MRKIGYFKFKKKYRRIEDGVYEYIIRGNYVSIINPIMINGYLSWKATIVDIKRGFKEGENGSLSLLEEHEISPVTPAIKALYGFSSSNSENNKGGKNGL